MIGKIQSYNNQIQPKRNVVSFGERLFNSEKGNDNLIDTFNELGKDFYKLRIKYCNEVKPGSALYNIMNETKNAITKALDTAGDISCKDFAKKLRSRSIYD